MHRWAQRKNFTNQISIVLICHQSHPNSSSQAQGQIAVTCLCSFIRMKSFFFFIIKMFPRYFFLLLEKRGWARKKSALYGEGDCSQWLWLLVAKIPTGPEAFFQMFSINPMRAPVPAHRQTRLKAESDEWVLLNEGLYVCSDPSHLLTVCWVWYQKHPCVSCTFIPSWSCLIVLKINNDINDFPKIMKWFFPH